MAKKLAILKTDMQYVSKNIILVMKKGKCPINFSKNEVKCKVISNNSHQDYPNPHQICFIECQPILFLKDCECVHNQKFLQGKTTGTCSLLNKQKFLPRAKHYQTSFCQFTYYSRRK